MRTIGGNIGQRERVLYTAWIFTFVWGIAAHYNFAADPSALTVLLSASAGVVASYTYKPSTTNTTVAAVAPETVG